MKQSDSPFLTQLYATFRDQQNYYILMELAEGGDVRSFLRNGSPRRQAFSQLGEEAIKFILGGVILALEELHNNNIVYSDLKPENILIFQDGYPKLTDFGVSRQYSNKPCTFKNGTTQFFSP